MPRKKPLLRTVAVAPGSRTATRTSEQAPFAGAWDGHLHATRVALAMIYEHASRGAGALSASERILTGVCELRCAMASGEWLGRLKANRFNELASARFALNEVGAMGVAAQISAAVAAIRRSSSVQHRETLLSELSRDLQAAGPTLDAVIAKFAQGLLDAGGGSAEFLATAPAPRGGDGAQRDLPADLDFEQPERRRRR